MTTLPTTEPFGVLTDLARGDQARVTDVYNAVWAGWLPGERPISTGALVDVHRFSAHPERIARRLVRDERGGLVGWGELIWRHGPGAANLRVMVDPAHRREGFGRAIGAALVADARVAGRSGVTVEVPLDDPAEEICAANGFRQDMEVEQNRTDPRSISVALLEEWKVAGEATAGYSLVAYDVPCPSRELAADFVEARMVMNDAPRWEGEPEATYTVEELTAVEAASVAAGLDWWNVGVRHDASGALVGLSEVYLPSKRPWMVFQGDTGVAAAHRGAWARRVDEGREPPAPPGRAPGGRDRADVERGRQRADAPDQPRPRLRARAALPRVVPARGVA